MNRVVHFEIQADDIERAATFYRTVFGWTIEKWESGSMEYWMVMTAEKDSTELGINGGLLKRSIPVSDGVQHLNAFVCTVQVNNFDETTKKINIAGGKVTISKFAIPHMAWQGYFLDTEGNVFGIHQPDTNAI